MSCLVPLLANPSPFGHLFDFLETPLVIGCDGSRCIWQQQDVFSQELECVAGVCVDDISAASAFERRKEMMHSPWTTYIIFAAIVIIILFVICTNQRKL